MLAAASFASWSVARTKLLDQSLALGGERGETAWQTAEPQANKCLRVHQGGFMSRPFIVLGDKTTHGGTVISADMTTSTHGKYMARVNDMTVCPKCKGTFPISSGADDMTDGAGNAYARHLDSAACGAKLISGQAVTTWDPKSSGSAAAAQAEAQAEAAAGSSAIAVVTNSGICLDCLMKAAAVGSSIVVRE
jgi:uncharacterized Zn-binding protein involved in type VI secretion